MLVLSCVVEGWGRRRGSVGVRGNDVRGEWVGVCVCVGGGDGEAVASVAVGGAVGVWAGGLCGGALCNKTVI